MRTIGSRWQHQGNLIIITHSSTWRHKRQVLEAHQNADRNDKPKVVYRQQGLQSIEEYVLKDFGSGLFESKVEVWLNNTAVYYLFISMEQSEWYELQTGQKVSQLRSSRPLWETMLFTTSAGFSLRTFSGARSQITEASTHPLSSDELLPCWWSTIFGRYFFRNIRFLEPVIPRPMADRI